MFRKYEPKYKEKLTRLYNYIKQNLDTERIGTPSIFSKTIILMAQISGTYKE